MTAAVKITIVGAQQVMRQLKQYRRKTTRAQGAALKRTSEGIRGAIRRAIQASEGIPLKATRKRVQWFWKARRGERPETKFWIGTRYPVTPREVPRLGRMPRGERTVNLAELSAPLRRLIVKEYRRRYPREFASQAKRFKL